MKKQKRFSKDVENMVKSNIFGDLLELGYNTFEISVEDLQEMTNLACEFCRNQYSIDKKFRLSIIDYYFAH